MPAPARCLAAEEQNLGCCWVQVHLRKDAQGLNAEENVREILSLPGKYRVVGFLVLGNIANNADIQ